MPIESLVIAPGERLPWFEVRDIDGSSVTTRSLVEWSDGAATDEVSVIAFLSPHSPYVNRIGAELGSCLSLHAANGVGVLCINSNDQRSYPADSPQGMVRQIERFGWDFCYAVDSQQVAAKVFGASCTPEFFVYRGRRLVFHGPFRPEHGIASPASPTLDEVLRAAAGRRALRESQQRAFGCSIKWSGGREPAHLLA